MGDYCPLIKKKCVEHKCKWYNQIIGTDPNTGTDVNKWDCAIAWLPMLLIEGTMVGNQTGAAIESFRNEMVNQNNKAQLLMEQTSDRIQTGEKPVRLSKG